MSDYTSHIILIPRGRLALVRDAASLHHHFQDYHHKSADDAGSFTALNIR
jgi:hypothetical protein